MSHLEENSSFVVEYWRVEHRAQPRHPLQVFLRGPNRALDQDFRKTLYTGQLPAAVVLANGSAVFCRIENKTIINDTVDKARLYWVANTFSRESRIWFPVFERRFLRRSNRLARHVVCQWSVWQQLNVSWAGHQSQTARSSVCVR